MSQYPTNGTTLNGMTNGRAMPWVRCEILGGANDPSSTWAISLDGSPARPPIYRELVVLNHRNEVILSFNLTSQPIDGAPGTAGATRRAVVRDALRTAAQLPDTDDDHLPDAWELDEFGRLDAVAAETPTASGLTALLAYGFGQSPHAAVASQGLRITRGEDAVSLSYTRRLARRPALLWSFERSQDPVDWLDWIDPTGGTVTTQFDGSGTERVTHTLPTDGPTFELFRLTLTVGADPPG